MIVPVNHYHMADNRDISYEDHPTTTPLSSTISLFLSSSTSDLYCWDVNVPNEWEQLRHNSTSPRQRSKAPAVPAPRPTEGRRRIDDATLERDFVASEIASVEAELEAAVEAAVTDGVDPTGWLPNELMIMILLRVG